MSARAAVASGSEFAPRDGELHDAGVALDEIASLDPGPEPVILRVSAEGGSEAERGLVAGDWLCRGGSAPLRIPAARWLHSAASMAWSSSRPAIDAWESCENAAWMLYAAADVGVDRRALVLAACACCELSAQAVSGATAGAWRSALDAAASWAQGSGDVDGARSAAERAVRRGRFHLRGLTPDDPEGESAARAAHAASLAASFCAELVYADEYRATDLAASVAYSARLAAVGRWSAMPDLVRLEITTTDFLLATLESRSAVDAMGPGW